MKFPGRRRERPEKFPVNVRIEWEDGRVDPLDLMWKGRERVDGVELDVWTNARPISSRGDMRAVICADEVPGRSQIAVNMVGAWMPDPKDSR